jgi:hypothetical protein|tara:strand:+ start:33 stop:182 length:150 start_codon:yes stop_codon:yes gene_type:complete
VGHFSEGFEYNIIINRRRESINNMKTFNKKKYHSDLLMKEVKKQKQNGI